MRGEQAVKPNVSGQFKVDKFLNPAEVPKVGVLNASGRITPEMRSSIMTFMKNLGEDAKFRGMRVVGGQSRSVNELFSKAPYEDVKVSGNFNFWFHLFELFSLCLIY